MSFAARPGSQPVSSSTGFIRKSVAISLSSITCCLLILGPYQNTAPAWASSRSKSDNSAPSGTLLIPIAPKLDLSQPTSPVPQETPTDNTQAKDSSPESGTQETTDSALSPDGEPESSVVRQEAKASADKISAEQGADDNPEGTAGEDTTLKGTIQLVADDTEYDQEKNTFLGTGNAVVLINGEDSKLEADTVLYDQNNQLIDARGNVRINRNGQLTTGSSFKFKVTSDEYLITNPDTELSGTTVIARKGRGLKKGVLFTNGTLTMPQPVHIVQNFYAGPGGQDFVDKVAHPDAFIPSKPSYTFTARKMTYERYKDQGNLTIFGGKLRFGNFDMPIPVPKFTLTIGQENKKAMFPITPLITNNLQMGGTSFGPSFNFAEGKNGVFSVAPLVQLGGASGGTGGGLGAGVRLGYRDQHIIAHYAYGSVSKMSVADFRYTFNRQLKFQAGINRYLEDGIFGYRRAHYIGEAVHVKSIGSIPFIASLSFRTAAGWMQDTPALLNQTPQFAKLFTPVQKSTISASRFQESINASTHPLFSVGDSKYGAKMFLFGGVGLKAYSTGDYLGIGQFGPILSLNLNRVQLATGYTQSGITGQSPFVFDEYIQGSKSAYLSGSFKLSKYISVGGVAGLNMDTRLLYQKTISAAIGPDDFKLMLSHDILTGYNRYGFDIIYGQGIPFNKLVVKGRTDQGQLGGI